MQKRKEKDQNGTLDKINHMEKKAVLQEQKDRCRIQ